MRLFHLTLALPLLLANTAVTSAGEPTKIDLTKIDRTIKKEPAYQTKTPKYCLLVFGPEANTRVWLVQDGDKLYVDRNGNGDLTEDGECVIAKKGENTDPGEGIFEFEAGDIPDGKLLHKALRVFVTRIDYLSDRDEGIKKALKLEPNLRGFGVRIDVEMPPWKGIGLGGRVEHMAWVRDINGLLRFGNTPKQAPIIQFGGPWQITLDRPQQLTIDREKELCLALATPGIGPGTLAYVGYEGVVPANVHPKVEIRFPAKTALEKPARELYELKERC